MLALILWTFLGWRAAFVEGLAEVAIAASISGGGGGRRIRVTLIRLGRRLTAGMRVPAPART
jgi:hypothetical protein